MTQRIGLGLSRYRKFTPLLATVVLFLLVYGFGALQFEGMRDPQVFFTLFITTPFLLISVIGEAFVVISGGIDLSVSGVIALTTVGTAALLRAGWAPEVVIPTMLLMGVLMGAIMGIFITYLKVQPFIATLAGMWFARGMCYIISDAEIRIYDPTWKLLAGTKLLIPGLADPVTQKGDYITILVLVSMAVFAAALYIAQFTKFGRTIYAMGGNAGANEQSARLMGLPVNRTKVAVYTLNGFCSALAGLAYSIYVGSGHGTHAWGFELTVIAAVVIGGILLTGGEGYMFGALFGVLITALIQTLIQFNGKLSSWWTSIVIGLLTLVFIGVQSLLASWNARQLAMRKSMSRAKVSAATRRTEMGGLRWAILGGVGVVVIALVAIFLSSPLSQGATTLLIAPTLPPACPRKPMRPDMMAELIKDGAVVAYERNGGNSCIDEVYGIYPDGRVTADNVATKLEKQITPAEVEKLLTDINNYEWFTPEMFSIHHVPCAACYSYSITVVYNGQEKTVTGVDGGTDINANYWQITAELTGLVPQFANE